MNLIDEKIEDIKAHPEKHRHDYQGLIQCCFVNGCINTMLMSSHSKHAPVGKNGGILCDVTEGPCSCGSWHGKAPGATL